jgi:hypothetical protein
MHIPKNFFHDRIILVLLSSSLFVMILNTLLTILRLDSSRGSYIVQYRSNLGLSAYKPGDSSTFISLIAFGVVIFLLQILLSMRAFKINRYYAIAIACLCLLLLILALIVSNSLLALR